jgi:hypothetical protein
VLAAEVLEMVLVVPSEPVLRDMVKALAAAADFQAARLSASAELLAVSEHHRYS